MSLNKNAYPHIARLWKRMMKPKECQRRLNLSCMDRKAAVIQQRVRQAALWKDLNEHWRRQDEVAAELAKKHQKDIKWMRLQLNRSMRYGQQHAPSTWNAYVHCKSLEINEGVEPGRKACLQEIQQLARTSSYKDIPQHEMDKMIHCLQEKRLKEKRGICLRPAAHLQDVGATVKRVGSELTNLGVHCQTLGLAIVVRTDSSHGNAPLSHHDDISRDFIELVFGMDFDDFTLKYDAYALWCIKGVSKNANDCKTMTKRIIGQMVKQGLRSITGKPDIDMEWKRYESKIVSVHSIELVGWPITMFDPHALGVKDLESCLAALKGPDPTCYWCRIPEEELTKRQEDIAGKKASGEIVTKEWKRQSDIGKKQGSYKKRGKRARESEDSDSEKENAQPGQHKKRKTRSVSIIPSDSD